MNKLDKIEKQLEKLSAEIKTLKEQEYEYIKSPFKSDCWNDDVKSLIVNDKQTLYYGEDTFRVVDIKKGELYNLKVCVTPTPKDKLEIGKWYVASDKPISKDKIDEIENYHLSLGVGEYVFYSDDGSFIKDNNCWKYWHEVVLDEDK